MRPRRTVHAAVACLAAALALPATPAAAATTARTLRVASVSALVTAVASARPGDRVELAGGSYTLRVPLEIKASGIVIAAAADRTAVITGTAGVRVTGSDVTLTGLDFRTADTIEIKAEARHVRVSRNAFRLAGRVVNWLSVAGDDAEIDHNQFAGKHTAGVFLQVTGPGGTAMAQRTWVHHNYFADHTFGGGNGGEALRLGVSSRQHAVARAVVEDNLFERVNGDQEAISVKSSGNVIRRNTIRDSKGTITLRHGSGNTVESNLLIGGTTGIRIFGNDQTVVNNIVQDSARSRSIEVGSGDMRDDTGSSTGHEAADRVLVAFNTVVVRAGAATALDVGDDGDAVAPDTITVADNVLVAARRSIRYERGTRISWLGNMVSGAVTGIPAGYRSVDPQLARDAYGVYRPVAGSPVFGAALGSFGRVGLDVDGQARPASGRSAGADEPTTARLANRRPATRATLGL